MSEGIGGPTEKSVIRMSGSADEPCPDAGRHDIDTGNPNLSWLQKLLLTICNPPNMFWQVLALPLWFIIGGTQAAWIAHGLFLEHKANMAGERPAPKTERDDRIFLWLAKRPNIFWWFFVAPIWFVAGGLALLQYSWMSRTEMMQAKARNAVEEKRIRTKQDTVRAFIAAYPDMDPKLFGGAVNVPWEVFFHLPFTILDLCRRASCAALNEKFTEITFLDNGDLLVSSRHRIPMENLRLEIFLLHQYDDGSIYPAAWGEGQSERVMRRVDDLIRWYRAACDRHPAFLDAASRVSSDEYPDKCFEVWRV